MKSEDSVVIARFVDRMEAELAAARLRSDGIEPVLLMDDGGGAIPALDLTRGIRLAVAPENEEIAGAVWYLTGGESTYVNGQVLAVDGGFEATGIGLPTLRRDQQIKG